MDLHVAVGSYDFSYPNWNQSVGNNIYMNWTQRWDGNPRCDTPQYQLVNDPTPCHGYQDTQNQVKVLVTASQVTAQGLESYGWSESRRQKKRHLYQEEPHNNDPVFEKQRKNAISAKRNREKQKARTQILKNLVEKLQDDNQRLREENYSLNSRIEQLENELFSIRATILTSSELSPFLHKLQNVASPKP